MFCFEYQIAIYLSLGLHKGPTSYRRSLRPSKDNIQYFKTWKFFSFFCIYRSFLPSWIRIQNADPDPATQNNVDPCRSGCTTLLLRVTVSDLRSEEPGGCDRPDLLGLLPVNRCSAHHPHYTIKTMFNAQKLAKPLFSLFCINCFLQIRVKF
jgi:hypothetical protein